jgi:hypothetical protein
MGRCVVACIDIDSLAQYERDAKDGRADALYNLGLAYSTGQGVGVDMVAATNGSTCAACAAWKPPRLAQSVARE